MQMLCQFRTKANNIYTHRKKTGECEKRKKCFKYLLSTSSNSGNQHTHIRTNNRMKGKKQHRKHNWREQKYKRTLVTNMTTQLFHLNKKIAAKDGKMSKQSDVLGVFIHITLNK